MWAEQAAQKFRAFLYSLNKLATRKDSYGQAQRKTAEGEAAQVGLDLEERESKGRPKQQPIGKGDTVDRHG
jgi:hypothetical protein